MRKKSFVVLLAASIVVICAAIAWAQAVRYEPSIIPSSHSSGRYQLFQGQYIVKNAAGKTSREFGVFKINTERGRVWLYSERKNKDGTSFKNWQIIIG